MATEFRKMRRFKQQLTTEECNALLKQEDRGMLAVNGDDGYPYVIPMNFYFDEKNNSLYLHSARTGYKIDALKKSSKVCFCLHDQGYTNGGWWQKHFKSVVIFGRIEFIDDPEKSLEYIKKYDLKFETPEEMESHVAREGHLAQMLGLKIEYMTGKRIIEGEIRTVAEKKQEPHATA